MTFFGIVCLIVRKFNCQTVYINYVFPQINVTHHHQSDGIYFNEEQKKIWLPGLDFSKDKMGNIYGPTNSSQLIHLFLPQNLV